MRTFYARKGTHQVGKFGAIPPTDPDDIIQSTPYFWPFSNFGRKKLLGTEQFLMRYALASVGHPLPTAKFLGGNAPLSRDMSVRKS